MIYVLVYFQGLKRKPITCKNQWRVLYPNWVNAEIHSFDWFTFLTSKCLASEWNLPWIIEETGLETIGHVQCIVHADWLRAFFNMVEPSGNL